MVRVGRLAEPARGVRAGGRVGGAGVAVRVITESAAAEGGLDLGLGGVTPEPQRLVVVAHPPPEAPRIIGFGRWIAGGKPEEGAAAGRRKGSAGDSGRRRGQSACRAFFRVRSSPLQGYWATLGLKD